MIDCPCGMLLHSICLLLLTFVLLRILASDDLCRLVEFDVPESVRFFRANSLEEKLFYKTEHICRNKPIFRSIKYRHFYQFQSPNNRWWSLYQTVNSTEKLGTREWCDAWNAKPLLAMPLGMFQHPLGKQKRTQRWQRVISNEKNRSYTYKPVSNVQLKCYYPPSTSVCQTQKLTFLFDLTESTNNEELHQMKLLSKTIIWLLYNQTKIALSYYRDTFHLISSFDNETSSKSLEHLFDSIDTLNQNVQTRKRFAVQWTDALHRITTQIYKRRLLLPINPPNITDFNQTSSNDSIDDEIYTEPYPLVYSDEHAIKTILNITDYPLREKRAIKSPYDRSNHVLVILTARSKNLYDYTQQDRRLAQFISTVPLRILVIDFNQLSNKKTAESFHSAFISNAKYALASLPVPYNYIETYEHTSDVIHGEQLFDHQQRLCSPMRENFSSILIETNENANADCLLLTLFNPPARNASLKEKFDYTFYPTSDQCFSALVYRSLGDRNIYAQRIANGRWLVSRVDPLLPSTSTIEQQYASTTTTTLSPEFFYATDYANGPMIDDRYNESSISDMPISLPHCSNNPGMEILWESDESSTINDYSLRTPRQWIGNATSTDIISPICNKYQISCRKIKYDFLLLIDSEQEYSRLIQTFFDVFLALIEPVNHRFSLTVLSSTTIDTFQHHLPFTSVNHQILENYLTYTDSEKTSTVPLNQHIDRLSEYLINNQQLTSNAPSKQVLFTVSSRLNFNPMDMKDLRQRYPTIRYMVLDPSLKIDDDHQRVKLFRSLASSPVQTNFFWSYAANRDLTFSTVFRVLESLCGPLR